MSNLIEGKDFYYADNGLMIFTKTYHLNRGYCCKNDCKHCPYKSFYAKFKKIFVNKNEKEKK